MFARRGFAECCEPCGSGNDERPPSPRDKKSPDRELGAEYVPRALLASPELSDVTPIQHLRASGTASETRERALP
jgi:hypothetical protein